MGLARLSLFQLLLVVGGYWAVLLVGHALLPGRRRPVEPERVELVDERTLLVTGTEVVPIGRFLVVGLLPPALLSIVWIVVRAGAS